MALVKRGDHEYGESQADIRTEIIRFSELNGYVAEHFADAVCVCNGRAFGLLLDDAEGAAVRVCNRCDREHPIGDSAEYLDEAELGECECPCGKQSFQITVGVALYADSEDVKWLYLGLRCVKCGLTAVYGDWKNEFEDFRKLLANV